MDRLALQFLQLLEDVKEQDLYLGCQIEINNKKLHFKYDWDHATWKIMSVNSAGSIHRKLSGLVLICHIAKTHRYPFHIRRQSIHEIAQSYVKAGFTESQVCQAIFPLKVKVRLNANDSFVNAVHSI